MPRRKGLFRTVRCSSMVLWAARELGGATGKAHACPRLEVVIPKANYLPSSLYCLPALSLPATRIKRATPGPPERQVSPQRLILSDHQIKMLRCHWRAPPPSSTSARPRHPRGRPLRCILPSHLGHFLGAGPDYRRASYATLSMGVRKDEASQVTFRKVHDVPRN